MWLKVIAHIMVLGSCIRLVKATSTDLKMAPVEGFQVDETVLSKQTPICLKGSLPRRQDPYLIGAEYPSRI